MTIVGLHLRSVVSQGPPIFPPGGGSGGNGDNAELRTTDLWSLEMIYGPNAQRQIIFYAGLGLLVGIIVVIVLKGLGIA